MSWREFFEKKARSILVQEIKKFTQRWTSKKPKPSGQNKTEKPPSDSNDIILWRPCPTGQHWVKTHPLHVPPMVKALIGSESSFNLKPKEQDAGTAGMARGFIQLTDQALRALNDPNGELKDHLIKISVEETQDPYMSICAGIRWLFQKKKLASNDLRREATWEEAIAKYKGVLKDLSEGNENGLRGLKNFRRDYGKFKK